MRIREASNPMSLAPGRPKAGETPSGGRMPYSADGGLS
jgi:hypothetical protein